ncbi:MAG: carboxypeptidase regulatory-like domain-containing protein [Gemmatimonadaceae bacterium]
MSLGFAAGEARAQEGEVGRGGVEGTVRDSLGLPVEGAQVSVTGSAMRGESDPGGKFTLVKSSVGPLTIHVRRIGFAPDSVRINVLAGKTVTANFVLRRLAMELRPVVVTGRREVTGRMAGFYQRQSRGIGYFISREQIERRNPSNMTDMFRMIPGVRVESRGFRTQVRFRGARCSPLTWMDGSPLYAGEFDLDSVDPRSFEGIEVYSGAASVPAEFQGNRSVSSACGTVVLWSRQGELRPKKRKKTEITAAAEIAELVAAKSVFTALQVDSPARVDSSSIQHPVYPDSLYENLVAGRLLAEFVVNQRGDVIIETFNVVTTTHALLIDPVRVALRDQQYFPAILKGNPVSQVVQQPFSFLPDSTARRRR